MKKQGKKIASMEGSAHTRGGMAALQEGRDGSEFGQSSEGVTNHADAISSKFHDRPTTSQGKEYSFIRHTGDGLSK